MVTLLHRPTVLLRTTAGWRTWVISWWATARATTWAISLPKAHCHQFRVYARVTYGTLEVPAGSGCEKHLPISKSKSTQGQQKGFREVLASHTCAHGMVCTNSLEWSYALRAPMSSSAGEIGMEELLGWLCDPVCWRDPPCRLVMYLYICTHMLSTAPPPCLAGEQRACSCHCCLSDMHDLPWTNVSMLFMCVPCLYMLMGNTSSALVLAGSGDMEQQQPHFLQAVEFSMIYFPLMNLS